MKGSIFGKIRKAFRIPQVDKDHIIEKSKGIIAYPINHEPINRLKENIRLPEIDKNHFVRRGKDLLDSGAYYEAQFYSKISNYSIPSISMMYANSKFRTNIYKATEESPCLDEILYKHESLIPYGKEYWFAIFTSLDGKKPMQLVSCFGRRNSRKSIIDDIEVNGLNPTGNELNTVIGAWCFDGKKKVFANSASAKTVADGKSISTTGEGLSMNISGTVPEYRVVIDSKEIAADFRLTKPAHGYDVEVLNEIKMGLNYQVYNLYYDFKGTLNGKEHAGRCYLQKVILSTPLPSWHWCRLVFKDGSFLVFFKPYLGSKEINYALRNKGLFYSAKHDKLFWFYNIDVYSDKKQANWRFRSTSDSYMLDVSVRAYTEHCPTFRGAGAFDYHEFFVNVRKFKFVSGDTEVTIKDTGAGAGTVEDGIGLWI